MNTPNTIDKTWKGSMCFPTGDGVQRGVGTARIEVLVEEGTRCVVSFCVVVEGAVVGVRVCVIVMGSVVVDVDVRVVVMWMNEVSNTDTVFSTVSVM